MKEIKNANDFLNAKKENCMIVFLPDSEVADYIANGSLNLLQEDTDTWKFYIAYATSLMDICAEQEIFELPAIYTCYEGEERVSDGLCEGAELGDNIAEWYEDEVG